MPRWKVVGGAEKGSRGGILVRKGQELGSPQELDRLCNGAVIDELELVGDRLNYRLITGTGPAEGWVSLSFKGRALVVPKDEDDDDDESDAGGPGEDVGLVELDSELKERIEAAARDKQRDGVFQLYLPKYEALGYPVSEPKLRVLCFHGEGSAESCYTGPGTPFLEWARADGFIEVCAFDFPGRSRLLNASQPASAEALAFDLLAVFYAKMCDSVPYLVWAHSVGTWVALEYLLFCRKVGLPMPRACIFVAFPAPHLPVKQRRWHKSTKLSDEKFKEEVTNWDRAHFTGAGKFIFEMPAWKDSFGPLMRADFSLFDRYKFQHKGAPRFDFPIHCLHFSDGYYTHKEMVELWKDWTHGTFELQVIEDMGHLTCFYKPDLRIRYFQKVTSLMKTYVDI